MKVIYTPYMLEICKTCKSTVEMRLDELSVVGRDWDNPSDDEGKSYWVCPVCNTRNFIKSFPDLD